MAHKDRKNREARPAAFYILRTTKKGNIMDTKQEAVSNGLAVVSIPLKDQERSKRF
jgi:hypothetical protein